MARSCRLCPRPHRYPEGQVPVEPGRGIPSQSGRRQDRSPRGLFKPYDFNPAKKYPVIITSITPPFAGCAGQRIRLPDDPEPAIAHLGCV